MQGRRVRGFVLALTWAVLTVPCAAGASSWSVAAAAPSSGEAGAQGAPAAPTGATSACTSPASNTVKVTWSAVAQATSYAVYSSTTGASSGYSLYATGIVSTSYTTAALATGTYWFEVAALLGANWASANSNATAQRTILVLTCL